MDVERIRRDFPVFRRPFSNGRLVYLDNACTSLKPSVVIDEVLQYYRDYPVCGGRSIHRLGHEVTERVEAARRRLTQFLNAPDPTHVVFTKNTTEAINLVAHGLSWKKGDVVVTTDKEHNSNWVPWLRLRQTHGIDVRAVPSTPEGRFDEEALERTLRDAGDRLRLVSIVHTSNADGVSVPLARAAKLAHEFGALVLSDSAQFLPHHPTDVRRLGVDFLAASIHKMMGPSGLGFLWGDWPALDELGPFQLGGGTVKRSTAQDYEWHDLPMRFEAGLQNYAALCALPAALDYLSGIGWEDIEAHDRDLNRHATKRVQELGAATVYGPPPEERGAILPFNIEGVDAHDVALFLDEHANVAIRSGAHCVNSYFARRGLEGWARASFYLYNTWEDVDTFANGLEALAKGVRASSNRTVRRGPVPAPGSRKPGEQSPSSPPSPRTVEVRAGRRGRPRNPRR